MAAHILFGSSFPKSCKRSEHFLRHPHGLDCPSGHNAAGFRLILWFSSSQPVLASLLPVFFILSPDSSFSLPHWWTATFSLMTMIIRKIIWKIFSFSCMTCSHTHIYIVRNNLHILFYLVIAIILILKYSNHFYFSEKESIIQRAR